MDRQLDRSILAVLREHGPVTGPEIAGILGAHPETVRRHCDHLQYSGRVTQVTGGAYVLANPQRGDERPLSD